MCDQMRLRILFIISLGLFLVIGMATPVMAFEFELNDFKTDKLVYEVGESVSMIANITAEFSSNGGCYASFSITTDLGPVYETVLSISSSPLPQKVRSVYLILPNETAPGTSGINASAVINIEAWDAPSYYEVASNTVVFKIMRGPLKVSTNSSLNIQYGHNATLCLLVASTHNSCVTLNQEDVLITILSDRGVPVYQTNITSDEHGMILLSLPSASWSPGSYNVRVDFAGNMAFLPFTQWLNMRIEPPSSTLCILEADESVFCIAPEGTDCDYFNVSVQHLSLDLSPITGSTVRWNTSFSSGVFNELFDGIYSTGVPFLVPPGNYTLNITAENPNYATAKYSMSVSVVPRPLNVIIQLAQQPVVNKTLDLVVCAVDNLTQRSVSSLPFRIEITVNGSLFASLTDVFNSTGFYSCSLPIPSFLYGPGIIRLTIDESVFYASLYEVFTFEVVTRPCFSIIILNPLIIGEFGDIVVYVTDLSGLQLEGLQIELYYQDYLVSQSITNSTGHALFHWFISREIGNGTHLFRLYALANPTKFIVSSELTFPLTYRYWIQLSSLTITECIRNATLSFIVTIDCDPLVGTQILSILIYDDMGEISNSCTIKTGLPVFVSIPLNYPVTLGPHMLHLLCLDDDFVFLTPPQIMVIAQGRIYPRFEICDLFYCESTQLIVFAKDDTNLTLAQFDVVLTIDQTPLLWRFQNVSSGWPLTLLLNASVSPGPHKINIEVQAQYMLPCRITLDIFVWIRTTISFTVSNHTNTVSYNMAGQTAFIAASISAGSIIRPPPILFSGTTSTESPTQRLTSPESCPKLSSGTNNLSTVSANIFTSSSGNGHMPLSFIDRTVTPFALAAITSSTERDVHPKEITPHSAFWGPWITTSLNVFCASSIFFLSRRTNAS